MDELEIRKSVAEILEVSPEDLPSDKDLESFPTYDSTARLSLMVYLSDLSGHPFELQQLQEVRTYGEVVQLLRRCCNGKGL